MRDRKTRRVRQSLAGSGGWDPPLTAGGWSPAGLPSCTTEGVSIHNPQIAVCDGVEMRMADPNKGDAVRTILMEMDVDDAPVAYLGNDESHEDAFRILQNRGLCVLVRPQWRETAADLWLRPPLQLLMFLRDWLKACRPADAKAGAMSMA